MQLRNYAEQQKHEASVTIITDPVKSQEKAQSTILSQKHVAVIFATSVLLVLIGGALVTFNMFLNHSSTVLKYSYDIIDKNTVRLREEVTADNSEKMVQYHVTSDNDGEWWIQDDFVRNLQVTKVNQNGDVKCFVSPLNTSGHLSPTDVNYYSNNKTYRVDNLKKSLRSMSFSEAPIANPSFISKSSMALCHNVPVYWEFPVSSPRSNDETEPQQADRNRRSAATELACKKLCCHEVCIKCGFMVWLELVVNGEDLCHVKHYGCTTSDNMYIKRVC